MDTVASRVYFPFQCLSCRMRKNGLTLVTMNQYVRIGVSQPPFSFAAFDLRKLLRRCTDAFV